MNAPVAAPGMNKQWVERRAKAVSRGISAGAPVIAAKAENSEIWDIEGNRYIDFGGGIAVVNTGHRHPLVMKRVYEQLEAFTDLQITWIGSESGEIAISDEFDLAVSLSEEEGSDE